MVSTNESNAAKFNYNEGTINSASGVITWATQIQVNTTSNTDDQVLSIFAFNPNDVCVLLETGGGRNLHANVAACLTSCGTLSNWNGVGGAETPFSGNDGGIMYGSILNFGENISFSQCLRYRLLRVKCIEMSLHLLECRLPAE